MKKSIFKYILYDREGLFNKDLIFLPITEQMIQNWAEQQLDRELTQKELYRLYWDFLDGDHLNWEVECAFRDAIAKISSENDEDSDKDFDEEMKAGNIQTVQIDTK